MAEFSIEKALRIIDCTRNAFDKQREGFCDGLLDARDLRFFETADLSRWEKFKSKYRGTTESFYKSLIIYERFFGDNNKILNKNDFRSVTIPRNDSSHGFVMKYPRSREVNVIDDYFGTRVKDPYRWLEDASSPEVKKWIADQDRLSRSVLGSLPYRERIVQRLKELYYVNKVSEPVKRNNRYFYFRRDARQEKHVYYYRDGANGKEKILIDPNRLCDKGNVSVGGTYPSYDGKKVAYTLKPNNADEAILYVMDVDSGKTSKIDVIRGAKYAVPKWTPNSDGFYYSWVPTDKKISVADITGFIEVRYHKLGKNPKSDKTIFERTNDPRKFVSTYLSRDGRWLFIYIIRGWGSNDIYIKDLTKEDSKFELLFKSDKSISVVIPWKRHFYIVTSDGSPNWRIDKVASANFARSRWKTIVPERKNVVIDRNVSIVGNHLVLRTIKNATSSLEIRTLEGELVRNIQMPGIGETGAMIGNPDDDEGYFTFQSFTMPPQVYKTSITTGEISLWAKTDVPIDASPYTVSQVFYSSKDGTSVPMFVVHRKDMPRDGSTPVILYGYGGFGVSNTPQFWSIIYPWLEAGGAFAVANLRGGGEYGEEWHRAGMRDKKQNVFDDFIAGSEYLIRKGYTNPDRLAIFGASNGGLLIGAAITQRPDLFRAAVCGIPLLDMVRYHKFGSIKTAIPEYGSADDEGQFKTLLAYSPYHHVNSGIPYPAVLFLSMDSDDRVDPMHARKMVAALQNASISDQPIFLRTQKNAGHLGTDKVRDYVEQNADLLAFLISRLDTHPHSK